MSRACLSAAPPDLYSIGMRSSALFLPPDFAQWISLSVFAQRAKLAIWRLSCDVRLGALRWIAWKDFRALDSPWVRGMQPQVRRMVDMRDMRRRR